MPMLQKLVGWCCRGCVQGVRKYPGLQYLPHGKFMVFLISFHACFNCPSDAFCTIAVNQITPANAGNSHFVRIGRNSFESCEHLWRALGPEQQGSRRRKERPHLWSFFLLRSGSWKFPRMADLMAALMVALLGRIETASAVGIVSQPA